jgi:hypothetical protein
MRMNLAQILGPFEILPNRPPPPNTNQEEGQGKAREEPRELTTHTSQ